MKTLKFRYFILAVAAVAIILLAGGHQLPKYASRLAALAALAIVDILYWLTLQKSISLRFKPFLTVAYWLPLFTLLSFFLVGIIAPYTQWYLFPRIYVPGILLILLIGKGTLLTFLIAGDFLMIPFNLIKWFRTKGRNFPGTWHRPRLLLMVSGGVSAFIMLVYFAGMFLWVRDYKVTTVEIPVKNLPEAFDGYRIVQLSDMHLGTLLNDSPLKKIVKLVNDQQPDAILFTGDMVNFTTAEAYPFVNTMKEFSAKDGIFAILGNHDYGEYNQWNSEKEKVRNNTALYDFYKQIGWHLLRNENSIIRKDTASIAIIGVENWSKSKRFGKKGDVVKALAGSEVSRFKILMSHDPSHWDGEVNSKFPQIGLTLSGHTHAFQLAFEYGDVKWSPSSMIFRQWGGLYEKVNPNGVKQFLYVNRGTGTLGYPGRIATRPEITILILRKSN